MPSRVKIRLRGGDDLRILNPLAAEHEVDIETLPHKPWQRRPARQITIPYPGDDAYRLLQSQVAVRLGAFSNTHLRIDTED